MRRVAILLIAIFLLASTLTVLAQDLEPVPRLPPFEPTPEIWPTVMPPQRLPGLTLESYRAEISVEKQVASTHIEQVFVNRSNRPLEATYLFALPEEATVSDLLMWVDGEAVEGQLLDSKQARDIYETIVRQQRDPALLEYIGRDLVQLRIFPVPAGGARKIELTYHQVVTFENGLMRYRLPLRVPTAHNMPIGQLSLVLNLKSDVPLRALYSPTHPIETVRVSGREAWIGYEAVNLVPEVDFELIATVAQEEIGLHVLSYRPAGEDGYFLLLAAPDVQADANEVVARDVVLVLDTSGSMQGEKMEQAKRALTYLLDRLGPEDRFNVVAFNTGIRLYAAELRPAAERKQAQEFVASLEASGSTDIHRALLEALVMFEDAERPAIVFFLTDGLPTVGVTDVDQILANVARNAPETLRLFTFGVGYDVNTRLLDAMAHSHRGRSAYVRPDEPIDEVVSALYEQVSTPVLVDLHLDFGSVVVEDTYPYPLPDLFAGEQLVLVGRYRRGGKADIVLSGAVNRQQRTFRYEDIEFVSAGGEPFIARLWARRKIGHLLTQVRLHGATEETVQEIVDLSLRYGIITPYTSYLVQEPGLMLNREEPSLTHAMPTVTAPASGQAAVEASMALDSLRSAVTAYSSGGTADRQATETDAGAVDNAVLRQVLDKAFLLQEGVWVDTTFNAETMEVRDIVFADDAYFALLVKHPELARYFALGPQVIVVLNGTAYRVVADH